MKLVVDTLTVIRGDRTILDGVSATVRAGEALILSGPNGSGKTTLLRALAGFLPAAGGSIRFDGGGADKTLVEQSHIVGHANAIKATLTARENLEFWLAFLAGSGGASREVSADRIESALAHFGLDALDDYPAAYLSAGQKRRLGLARLLIVDRPVWLLDEPTVSLDVASTQRLAAAIDAHTTQGGLVIAATHVPMGLQRSREFALLSAIQPPTQPPLPEPPVPTRSVQA